MHLYSLSRWVNLSTCIIKNSVEKLIEFLGYSNILQSAVWFFTSASCGNSILSSTTSGTLGSHWKIISSVVWDTETAAIKQSTLECERIGGKKKVANSSNFRYGPRYDRLIQVLTALHLQFTFLSVMWINSEIHGTR